MPSILITGGLGRLGRPLLKKLLDSGFHVRALRLATEAQPDLSSPNFECLVGDIRDAQSLIPACRGVSAVMHLAGILQSRDPAEFERINAQGTRNLIAASEMAGVQHFVFISSISVTYSALSPYAISKLDAEAALQASKLPHWTVIRPTLIYDDQGGALEFAALVQYVARYPLFALPEGGKALKRPLHAEDAGSLLAQLPMQSQSFGKTYALAGGQCLSLRSMTTAIAKGLRLRRICLSLPRGLALSAADWADHFRPGGSVGRQGMLGLLQDAAPDISDLQGDFDFQPRGFLPTEQSLRLAAGWDKP